MCFGCRKAKGGYGRIECYVGEENRKAALKDADFVVCDRSILDTQNKIEMVFVNGERVV